MKRARKKYERPAKPYDKQRIAYEMEILKNYGLRRKKEIWRAESMLRKFRRLARELAARHDEKKEKMLIEKLVRLGVLNEGAALDDVLGLSLNNFLERRLQTVVRKKNIAKTIKQARQMIVHGHVRIGGRKITYPNYLVSREEENKIIANMQTHTKVEKNAGEA